MQSHLSIRWSPMRGVLNYHVLDQMDLYARVRIWNEPVVSRDIGPFVTLISPLCVRKAKVWEKLRCLDVQASHTVCKLK